VHSKDFLALIITYVIMTILLISPPLALALFALIIYPGSVVAGIVGAAIGWLAVLVTVRWLNDL